METIMLAGIGLVIMGVVALLHARRQQRVGFEWGVASTAEERAALIERVASRDRQIMQVTQTLESAQAALAARETVHRELVAANAALHQQLEAEQKSAAEKLELLENAQADLKTSFESLSGQALQANNRMFLDLAQQTLGKHQQAAEGELKQREQAIAELVSPVRQSLDKLDTRINEMETKREGAYSALVTTVDTFQRDMRNLSKALRQPAARGQWGELQLRNAVQAAGMLAHCDFTEQVTVGDADARLRPDLVVHLPGGGNVVVDAKVPLLAYLDAVEAEDDDVAKRHLADHARQVRDHIMRLGRKAYHEQFENSPEIVVLFMPAESQYAAALQHDPALIEYGASEKVIVATPSTLIALLRAVALGWKQEALARNAREISELGRQLHDRIAKVAEHWAKMGRNLGNAVDAYNESVRSMESRVLVTARRFRDLDAVGDGREIVELAQVEVRPRELQAVEMQGEAA